LKDPYSAFNEQNDSHSLVASCRLLRSTEEWQISALVLFGFMRICNPKEILFSCAGSLVLNWFLQIKMSLFGENRVRVSPRVEQMGLQLGSLLSAKKGNEIVKPNRFSTLLPFGASLCLFCCLSFASKSSPLSPLLLSD